MIVDYHRDIIIAVIWLLKSSWSSDMIYTVMGRSLFESSLNESSVLAIILGPSPSVFQFKSTGVVLSGIMLLHYNPDISTAGIWL